MRGRTRPGRLRLLDGVLSREGGGLTVDVGLGDEPVTTVELFELLGPKVVGVDSDSGRVARAQSFARPGLAFLQRSWSLELDQPPRLIRAMNVLREYPVHEAAEASERLASQLAEGGLLVEGSTDVDGALGSAHLWRKRGGAVVGEGLLFFTDFSRGFAPMMFRDVLPRDLRREVKPGTGIHAFLQTWQRRFDDGRAAGENAASGFDRACESLAQTERRGVGSLVWRPLAA